MSHDRNFKFLDRNRIVTACMPEDEPTLATDKYLYYENGTHQCYTLFRSKAKINTYRSLKWHLMVLYYLNMDTFRDHHNPVNWLGKIASHICDKKNGFITFTISDDKVQEMLIDVVLRGDTPPKNRIRKVIFKPFCGLEKKEKLSIVGKLIGRKKITQDKIYSMMLEINDMGARITIKYLADLLGCSTRTLYRNMGEELKKEKDILNSQL
tara:strand:- start:3458 stop:4087 length:630 start_codon:yes stop_codon:yes gene_type:complete